MQGAYRAVLPNVERVMSAASQLCEVSSGAAAIAVMHA
jgi:hypothetical protein